MDNGSVELAKKVTSMIGFKYFQEIQINQLSTSINTGDYLY